MTSTPYWTQPSHPDLINVVKSTAASYSSYATSLVSLPPGALFAPITNHHYVCVRTYATVEAPHGRIIDLGSDLFYINHSCDPALEFDMERMEVRVSRHRALERGDVLTFFYPSTESYMAQVFECRCAKQQCKGKIMGAGEMGREALKGYWLNQHVEEQLREKGVGEA